MSTGGGLLNVHPEKCNFDTNDRWDDTRILQHGSRSMELVVKEAICIRTTPESSLFNLDGGYNIPDCWIATYKKLKVESTWATPT